MALMLLVSAGLLLRSLGNLLSVDPGIRQELAVERIDVCLIHSFLIFCFRY